jgi:hypothetical protein
MSEALPALAALRKFQTLDVCPAACFSRWMFLLPPVSAAACFIL